MTATDTFKNSVGDIYEVRVFFSEYLSAAKWRVYVAKKPKGKRKFTAIGSTDDQLRSKGVPFKDYDNYRIKEYLREIPWKWIESVMRNIVAEIYNSICETKPLFLPEDED